MTYKEIKHKLPANFVNKPNTVILVDDKGEPWYMQNNDGTFSGFPVEILNRDEKPSQIKFPGNRES